jgi:thiamine kinase-like enzyme
VGQGEADLARQVRVGRGRAGRRLSRLELAGIEVERIAARVWPDGWSELEPLGGGITNRNFKVVAGGEAFVLRVGGADTHLLGIDRDAEHRASLAAAAAGVAPEVVAFVEPEGYLVTRFVEGAPVPVEEMRRPERLAAVVAALHRFHDGAPVPGRFDAFRVVEAYEATAAERGVAVPPEYARAKALADAIERRLDPRPLRPCHNDLLNANFIGDGGRLWIVDWEYAGMGDPLFDLANFAVNHELDAAGDDELLRAYSGELRAEERRDLRLLRFMSDFREAMWGVVQQAVSELDFDFRGYAAEHFERLERTAATDEFRAALH